MMQESTIATIKMLVAADPDCTPAQQEAILAACKPGYRKREQISTREAARIIGCQNITVLRYARAGHFEKIAHSRRNFKFFRDEIERFAYSKEAK